MASKRKEYKTHVGFPLSNTIVIRISELEATRIFEST